MAADGAATGAELQAFIANQTAGFYSFIASAVREYNKTGALPAEVFGEAGTPQQEAGKKKRKAGGGEKKPRAMNAFNYFVKQKMVEYKEQGVKPDVDGDKKGLFTKAVGEWSSMPKDKKDAYTAQFKASHGAEAGEGAANGAAPAADAAAASTPVRDAEATPGKKKKDKSEKKKHKKHKHRHSDDDGAGGDEKRKDKVKKVKADK